MTAIQRDPKLPIGDAARKDLERRKVLRYVTEKFPARDGTVPIEQRAPGADLTRLQIVAATVPATDDAQVVGHNALPRRQLGRMLLLGRHPVVEWQPDVAYFNL